MFARPRLPEAWRENHVPLRLLAALAVAPVAGAVVTLLTNSPPSTLAVLGVGLVLGVAVAVVTTLGRSGIHTLGAPVADAEAEPVEVVQTTPTVQAVRPLDELAVYRADRRPVRHQPYDDTLLAVAEDAGVYRPGRHALVPPCDTDTTTFPAVQA